jgi:hypothetical protein
MSDSLPENSLSGILRVVKLSTGEEIIGLINEASPDKYSIKLPARLDCYLAKDETGTLVEYVKLTNYLANIKGFEVSLPRHAVIYIGSPAIELEKMYETYFMTMQTDPKSVVTSGNIDDLGNAEPGLQLLNDLFNNEDFINFVNDLMDNFEAAELIIDEEDAETSIEEVIEEQLTPKKKKKKSKIKPESKKLPYNPEANPNTAEGWSDNPEDYL